MTVVAGGLLDGRVHVGDAAPLVLLHAELVAVALGYSTENS